MRINPEALRTIRLSRDVTVTHLAELAGISQAYLSNIEAGRKSPGATIIRRLASELKCSVLSLLGPEDPAEAEREVRAAS